VAQRLKAGSMTRDVFYHLVSHNDVQLVTSYIYFSELRRREKVGGN
jgi:hypothetical protein